MQLPENVTWTLGVSFDNYDEKNLRLQKTNSKFGLQWDVTPSIRFRLAAFRTVKPPLVTNRTIQPTQIAGFNQFFDDVNGTESWRYGAGLDFRITPNLSAGIDASRRNLKEPVLTSDGFVREDKKETFYCSYLYWILDEMWAMSGELQFDNYQSDKGVATQADLPTRVETISAPLSVRYFHPTGLFGGLTGTLVHQEVNQQHGSDAPEGHSNFFVLDAAMGYRRHSGGGSSAS